TLIEGLNLSMGRFLSSSGFEAAEPTGLYQFSWSKTLVYGYYQNGLNLSYTAPMFGLYGAVVSDLWVPGETELLNSPGFEGQVSLTPAEGVTVKATGLWQMYDADANPLKDDGQGLLNVWGQFAKGPITAAAEFNLLMNWTGNANNDASGMGWLAMVNYKFTDKFATTLRYSALTIDDEVDATDDMGSEVTVSPSFAVSPNWLVLAEYRMDFGNVEQSLYAVESIFYF
ncbi:MAG: porin, partial [Fibrobacterota bacterium]|nr:porin [Fibrobacterota bacterium]